ncbi:MAG: hypothetical protein JEZ04_12865 [Spirochaetales bacterium]|nr:hypothetical protein [Spirochaetales bacterium]
MKKVLLFLICTIVSISALSAQDVPEKKEIAIFPLSYSNWLIPSGALSLVDQQVIRVFTNLGRFKVKGLDRRLGSDDVSEFILKIQEINESNMAADEKYRLGTETFTQADFMALTKFSLIVVPSLSFYDSVVVDSDDRAEWEVELQTAFSIIRVKDSSLAAQFTIGTYGSGETLEEAARNAADAVSAQLDFELRCIEEFQLKSGILEVMSGGRVILELGSNMGLVVGDEFQLVTSRVLSSGGTVKDKNGLLVVTDVRQELSYALVVYSDEPVYSGDQLSEVPRLGCDVSVYAHGFFDLTGLSGGTVGVRSVLSRGFWDLRPLFGIEVPLLTGTLNSLWPGLPLTVYGGGELLWYIGRFQIEPSIALGATGLIPIAETDEFLMTHIGGSVALTLNWMFSDNMRLFAEGGYSYWFSIAPKALTSVSEFGGIFGGLGVTFKL